MRNADAPSPRPREPEPSPPTERPLRKARVTVGLSDSDGVGIADLVMVWRAAGLRTVHTLDCYDTGAVVQFDVEERLPDGRLDAVKCVDRWDHVASTTDGERYVVAVTAPRFPPTVAHRTAEVVGAFDLGVTEHGLVVSLVGTRSAIADIVEDYETAGLAPDVRRLLPYDGAPNELDGLSERQREVLTTAYKMGYYEVPRETTAEAVAAAFDINTSTVTEHLQRAERNLLGRYLSG